MRALVLLPIGKGGGAGSAHSLSPAQSAVQHLLPTRGPLALPYLPILSPRQLPMLHWMLQECVFQLLTDAVFRGVYSNTFQETSLGKLAGPCLKIK